MQKYLCIGLNNYLPNKNISIVLKKPASFAWSLAFSFYFNVFIDVAHAINHSPFLQD